MLRTEFALKTRGDASIDYNRYELTYAQRVAQRLADWSDQARLAGRGERSGQLLILAWAAYEQLPAVSARSSRQVQTKSLEDVSPFPGPEVPRSNNVYLVEVKNNSPIQVDLTENGGSGPGHPTDCLESKRGPPCLEVIINRAMSY